MEVSNELAKILARRRQKSEDVPIDEKKSIEASNDAAIEDEPPIIRTNKLNIPTDLPPSTPPTSSFNPLKQGLTDNVEDEPPISRNNRPNKMTGLSPSTPPTSSFNPSKLVSTDSVKDEPRITRNYKLNKMTDLTPSISPAASKLHSTDCEKDDTLVIPTNKLNLRTDLPPSIPSPSSFSPSKLRSSGKGKDPRSWMNHNKVNDNTDNDDRLNNQLSRNSKMEIKTKSSEDDKNDIKNKYRQRILRDSHSLKKIVPLPKRSAALQENDDTEHDESRLKPSPTSNPSKALHKSINEDDEEQVIQEMSAKKSNEEKLPGGKIWQHMMQKDHGTVSTVSLPISRSESSFSGDENCNNDHKEDTSKPFYQLKLKKTPRTTVSDVGNEDFDRVNNIVEGKDGWHSNVPKEQYLSTIDNVKTQESSIVGTEKLDVSHDVTLIDAQKNGSKAYIETINNLNKVVHNGKEIFYNEDIPPSTRVKFDSDHEEDTSKPFYQNKLKKPPKSTVNDIGHDDFDKVNNSVEGKHISKEQYLSSIGDVKTQESFIVETEKLDVSHDVSSNDIRQYVTKTSIETTNNLKMGHNGKEKFDNKDVAPYTRAKFDSSKHRNDMKSLDKAREKPNRTDLDMIESTAEIMRETYSSDTDDLHSCTGILGITPTEYKNASYPYDTISNEEKSSSDEHKSARESSESRALTSGNDIEVDSVDSNMSSLSSIATLNAKMLIIWKKIVFPGNLSFEATSSLSKSTIMPAGINPVNGNIIFSSPTDSNFDMCRSSYIWEIAPSEDSFTVVNCTQMHSFEFEKKCSQYDIRGSILQVNILHIVVEYKRLCAIVKILSLDESSNRVERTMLSVYKWPLSLQSILALPENAIYDSLCVTDRLLFIATLDKTLFAAKLPSGDFFPALTFDQSIHALSVNWTRRLLVVGCEHEVLLFSFSPVNKKKEKLLNIIFRFSIKGKHILFSCSRI